MTRSQALAGERLFLDGIVMVTNLGRWHPSDDRSEARRPDLACSRRRKLQLNQQHMLIKLDLLSIHCTDNVEWRRGTGGPADPPAPLKLRLPFIHVQTATRPNVDVDRRKKLGQAHENSIVISDRWMC
jgi:hypothetical protein